MFSRHPALLFVIPLMLGVLAPTPSQASCDVVEQCIPQPTCPYISSTEVTFRESPSKMSNCTLRNPSHCEPPPGSGVPVDSFFDIDYGWDFISAPGAPPIHRKGSTTGTIRMMVPASDGSIELELLPMDLSVAGDTIKIKVKPRESPTRASLGRQVPTPNPGGGYHIDSFFDVFFELSVDGGLTWSDAEQSAHFDLTQEQPTPARIATWGTMKALYR